MRIALILAMGLAALSLAAPSEKIPLPQELQAGELPWFAVAAKDGKGTYSAVINRESLLEAAKERKAKRVAIVFFARWCVPCREGLKRMGDNAEELKKRGVLALLVNAGEKDLDNYYAGVDGWARQYMKDGWMLGFNKYSSAMESFGIKKPDASEAPMPRTLVTDENLRPLLLIGSEGDDYIQLLGGEL